MKNCNSCAENLKKLKYTVKKCNICRKRCFFRLNKMIKCLACKTVYHKRCLAAEVAAKTAEETATMSRATTTSEPTEVTMQPAAGLFEDRADTPPVEQLVAAGNIADHHRQRPMVVSVVVSGAPRHALTQIGGSAESGHPMHELMDVVARVFGPVPAVHALLQYHMWTNHDTSINRLTRQVPVIRFFAPPHAPPSIQQTISVFAGKSVYNRRCLTATEEKTAEVTTVVSPPSRAMTRIRGSAASGYPLEVLMDVIARVFGPAPAIHNLLWSNQVTTNTRLTRQNTVIQPIVLPLAPPATQQIITVFKPKIENKKRVIYISLKKEVKLNKNVNAWVPSIAKKAKNENEIDLKTEYIHKNVRSILNKITPDNMDTLTEEFKALPIDSFDLLQKTVDLVLEKAIEEQSFAPIYASLCSSMQTVQVNSPDNKIISFKRLLIIKCQSKFKCQFDNAHENNESKLRKRAVGNCRFIGELYKTKILTPNVIYYCCENLVSRHSEAPLECLCVLIKTIGEELEQYYNLNDIFDKLKALTCNETKNKIPTRIKFMIEDIINLRRNKWIPR